MKTLRSKTGPFTEQPYFELEEIERTCTDELRRVNLYPSAPSAIKIDLFIEKRFGVSPRYEYLKEGVLGYTTFGPRGVEEIVISRELSENHSKAADRVLSSTLAHEVGHGLFHAYLFVLGEKPLSLFQGESEAPEILCRDVTGCAPAKRQYNGRWWEFQANRAIGALLMPRELVEKATEPYLVAAGSLEIATLDQRKFGQAVVGLSDIFEVNPAVARIRLTEMYPAEPQLSL